LLFCACALTRGEILAHAAVSPRPPNPSYKVAARAEGNTYAAVVWASSVVQGPFSAAPCQTNPTLGSSDRWPAGLGASLQLAAQAELPAVRVDTLHVAVTVLLQPGATPSAVAAASVLLRRLLVVAAPADAADDEAR
jgi:hypothetical protein